MKNNSINVVYDIFCDASVGPERKGCCSGILIERRPLLIETLDDQPMFSGIDRTFLYSIQPDGTNNSGEIAAVAMGVMAAYDINRQLTIYRDDYTPWFNIFSDSLISIRGVRDWFPNWIKNMDKHGNLINSSGNIVANQEFFKYIYNTITMNDININFFHQDGHVISNVTRIIPGFIQNNNGVSPLDIGISCMQLCASNDFVDNETRRIINQYISLENTAYSWPDNISVEHLKNKELCTLDPTAYMAKTAFKFFIQPLR